jgi:hypothetical protein
LNYSCNIFQLSDSGPSTIVQTHQPQPKVMDLVADQHFQMISISPSARLSECGE